MDAALYVPMAFWGWWVADLDLVNCHSRMEKELCVVEHPWF